eukprot:6492195-Amphidinium_carterae.3
MLNFSVVRIGGMMRASLKLETARDLGNNAWGRRDYKVQADTQRLQHQTVFDGQTSIERNPESHSSPKALNLIRIDIAPQDLIRIQLRGWLLLVVLITSSLAGADALLHIHTR